MLTPIHHRHYLLDNEGIVHINGLQRAGFDDVNPELTTIDKTEDYYTIDNLPRFRQLIHVDKSEEKVPNRQLIGVTIDHRLAVVNNDGTFRYLELPPVQQIARSSDNFCSDLLFLLLVNGDVHQCNVLSATPELSEQVSADIVELAINYEQQLMFIISASGKYVGMTSKMRSLEPLAYKKIVKYNYGIIVTDDGKVYVDAYCPYSLTGKWTKLDLGEVEVVDAIRCGEDHLDVFTRDGQLLRYQFDSCDNSQCSLLDTTHPLLKNIQFKRFINWNGEDSGEAREEVNITLFEDVEGRVFTLDSPSDSNYYGYTIGYMNYQFALF